MKTHSVIICLLLISTGCQTYTDQSKIAVSLWENGDIAGAEAEFSRLSEKKAGTKDHVLYKLETGLVHRDNGNTDLSQTSLQSAEDRISDYENKGLISLSQTSMEAGTYMSNQANRPYVGRSYDKTMLHVYKALNFWKTSDDEHKENVRPELMKGKKRQEESLEANRREVERAKQEELLHKDQQNVSMARQDQAFTAQVANIQSDLSHLKDYDDFANPYLELLISLYYTHHGVGQTDRETAAVALKRLKGMVGESLAAWEEQEAVLESLSSGASLKPKTILLFESGRIASLEQIRIDIPIIINNVSYVGAAFPKLVFHDNFYSSLMIHANGESHGVSLVCNLDALAAHDYKKEFPVMLTRTIISTVAKGVAAYAMNKAASEQDAMVGLFMRLGTAIAQAAVNIADTRSWSVLPKKVYFAQFDTPDNGAISIATSDGKFTSDVVLTQNKNQLVIVRSINQDIPPMVDVFDL